MDKADVQTSLRMPEELRDRLARAAKENGRGIGEEIRQRLEASFGGVSVDEKTGRLLAMSGFVTQFVNKHCARWDQNPFGFAVVKAAVETLLAQYRPEGEIERPIIRDRSAIMFFEHEPEACGRAIAGLALQIAEKQP
jgi:Arc-like DNA binding domain